ncbi:MAG: SPOR domain-containing protein [Thermodesulfovibrio sp.]|nr:SPOR domain-containing protein [Thermodesulfovibrio sp.]MDW7998966.1 SPOR domain-containing protein [Thermodesulfovibrio sp.]
MKKKGDELIVMQKRTFLLVILGIAIIGVLIGYIIGYMTMPTKEIYVQKTPESEKTVLPSISEPQPPKKQENLVQPDQSKISEKENIQIIKEVEANEKKEIEENKESLKPVKTEKSFVRKTSNRKNIYTVQLGAFQEIENAEVFMKKLKEEGIIAQLIKDDLYKIRTGYYKRFNDAQRVSNVLRSKGFENFIVKISKN